MVVRAIFTHARSRGWIDADPSATVERQPVRYSGDYDYYSREEIAALVGAAANSQDAAVYLTAAMSGLRRGELVALRWRDIDFPGQAIRVRANYSYGELVTPKSGKIRSVPMVPEVADHLADSRSATRSPAMKTPCSSARTGVTWTHRLSDVATPTPSRGPSCDRCLSTPCATTSDRWPSTARRLSKSNRGWDTHTSKQPPGIYTRRARPTMRPSSSVPLRRQQKAQSRCRQSESQGHRRQTTRSACAKPNVTVNQAKLCTVITAEHRSVLFSGRGHRCCPG